MLRLCVRGLFVFKWERGNSETQLLNWWSYCIVPRVIAWGNWARRSNHIPAFFKQAYTARRTCLLGLNWYLIKHLSHFPRQMGPCLLWGVCSRCNDSSYSYRRCLLQFSSQAILWTKEWTTVITNTRHFCVKWKISTYIFKKNRLMEFLIIFSLINQ